MKKATGNKKGQEAFRVLQLWREEGLEESITGHEAWILTVGRVGKCYMVEKIRLIEVAMKYANKGGSVNLYLDNTQGVNRVSVN
jgi:hypothetical protein